MQTIESRVLALLGIEEGESLSPEVTLLMLDLNQLVDTASTAVAFVGYNGTGAEGVKARLAAVVMRAKGEA